MPNSTLSSLPKLIIYWCRRDFRLTDNPALFQAVAKAKDTNTDFLPMFILDDGILKAPSSSFVDNNQSDQNKVNIGYPRRLFLSKVLSNFAFQFPQFYVLKGDYKQVFEILSQRYDLEVFVNEDIEPYSISRDNEVSKLVNKFHSYSDQISVDKSILSGTGNFYSVFSPFKRAVWSQFIESQVLPKVIDIPITQADIRELELEILPSYEDERTMQKAIFELIDIPWTFYLPSGNRINLDDILERPTYDEWKYTESDCQAQFQNFITSGKLANYKNHRDDLAMDTLSGGQTSRMSVALKWGIVSSRYLKKTIEDNCGSLPAQPLGRGIEGNNEGIDCFISELIWREFYKYILYHRPDVLNLEFQPKYQNTIDWVDDDKAQYRLVKWIKGETGYPAVDASMNQISNIGWMHNRARMMVASILTKNLGVNWRYGQEYFRAVLLDLDESANNGGWQWASSTGSDSKPIRIFNPYLQAQNYDKNNLYQKHWLPKDYKASFEPIVEHSVARQQALKRYGVGDSRSVRDF